MWTNWGKLPAHALSVQVSSTQLTIEAVHNYSFEPCGVARSCVSRMLVRFAPVILV
jgi:hypothetical protein